VQAYSADFQQNLNFVTCKYTQINQLQRPDSSKKTTLAQLVYNIQYLQKTNECYGAYLWILT